MAEQGPMTEAMYYILLALLRPGLRLLLQRLLPLLLLLRFRLLLPWQLGLLVSSG